MPDTLIPGYAFATTFDRQDSPQPLVRGNIDLKARPIAQTTSVSGRQPDATATVMSMSIGVDGREVLIPRVSDDGRIMSEQEAVDTFFRTGRMLGVFRNVADANAAAERIHQDQAVLYGDNGLNAAGKSQPSTRKEF